MFDLRNLAAWRVTYAARLTAGDRRFLDGILVVRRDSRRLLLLNSSEQIVDSRGIGDKEDILIGGVVFLPRNEVRIPAHPLAPESLVDSDLEKVTGNLRDPGALCAVGDGGSVVEDCCGEIGGDPFLRSTLQVSGGAHADGAWDVISADVDGASRGVRSEAIGGDFGGFRDLNFIGGEPPLLGAGLNYRQPQVSSLEIPRGKFWDSVDSDSDSEPDSVPPRSEICFGDIWDRVQRPSGRRKFAPGGRGSKFDGLRPVIFSVAPPGRPKELTCSFVTSDREVRGSDELSDFWRQKETDDASLLPVPEFLGEESKVDKKGLSITEKLIKCKIEGPSNSVVSLHDDYGLNDSEIYNALKNGRCGKAIRKGGRWLPEWYWIASFSTVVCQQRTSPRSGILFVYDDVRQLILLDEDEVLLDLLNLGPNQLVFPGAVIEMPMYRVTVEKFTKTVRQDSGMWCVEISNIFQNGETFTGFMQLFPKGAELIQKMALQSQASATPRRFHIDASATVQDEDVE